MASSTRDWKLRQSRRWVSFLNPAYVSRRGSHNRAQSRRLEETCHLATQVPRTRRGAIGDTGAKAGSVHNELLWRDRILANLDSVLEP